MHIKCRSADKKKCKQANMFRLTRSHRRNRCLMISTIASEISLSLPLLFQRHARFFSDLDWSTKTNVNIPQTCLDWQDFTVVIAVWWFQRLLQSHSLCDRYLHFKCKYVDEAMQSFFIHVQINNALPKFTLWDVFDDRFRVIVNVTPEYARFVKNLDLFAQKEM